MANDIIPSGSSSGTYVPPTRPGVQTSEFKAAIAAAFIGILAMFGVVDQGDVPEVTDTVTRASGAFMVLASALTYIWSRVRVKRSG